MKEIYCQNHKKLYGKNGEKFLIAGNIARKYNHNLNSFEYSNLENQLLSSNCGLMFSIKRNTDYITDKNGKILYSNDICICDGKKYLVIYCNETGEIRLKDENNDIQCFICFIEKKFEIIGYNVENL